MAAEAEAYEDLETAKLDQALSILLGARSEIAPQKFNSIVLDVLSVFAERQTDNSALNSAIGGSKVLAFAKDQFFWREFFESCALADREDLLDLVGNLQVADEALLMKAQLMHLLVLPSQYGFESHSNIRVTESARLESFIGVVKAANEASAGLGDGTATGMAMVVPPYLAASANLLARVLGIHLALFDKQVLQQLHTFWSRRTIECGVNFPDQLETLSKQRRNEAVGAVDRIPGFENGANQIVPPLVAGWSGVFTTESNVELEARKFASTRPHQGRDTLETVFLAVAADAHSRMQAVEHALTEKLGPTLA